MELLFTLPHFNQLYEVMKFISYPDLIKIRYLDRDIYYFCKSNRLVQALFIKGETDKFIRDNNNDLFYAFIASCDQARLEIVDELIKRGVNPSNNSDQVLHNLSRNGKLRIIERLLQDERVDPSCNDNLPIRLASFYGKLDIVDRLLKDPRVDPVDSIQLASNNKHYAVVQRLLQDPRVISTERERGYFSRNK